MGSNEKKKIYKERIEKIENYLKDKTDNGEILINRKEIRNAKTDDEVYYLINSYSILDLLRKKIEIYRNIYDEDCGTNNSSDMDKFLNSLHIYDTYIIQNMIYDAIILDIVDLAKKMKECVMKFKLYESNIDFTFFNSNKKVFNDALFKIYGIDVHARNKIIAHKERKEKVKRVKYNFRENFNSLVDLHKQIWKEMLNLDNFDDLKIPFIVIEPMDIKW